MLSCLNCGKEAQSQCQHCKVAYYCGEVCQKADFPKHSTECDEPSKNFKPLVQNKWTGLLSQHAVCFARWADALKEYSDPKALRVIEAEHEMREQLCEWEKQAETKDVQNFIKSYADSLTEFGTAVVLHDAKQDKLRKDLQIVLAQNAERIFSPGTIHLYNGRSGDVRTAFAKTIDAYNEYLHPSEEVSLEPLLSTSISAGKVFWGRKLNSAFTQ